MSNPYTQEILSAVANRIGRDRILVAHDWVHERLQEYGVGALGPDAMSVIGAPVERTWLTEHGTILDSIRRLHDESAESVYAIQRPAHWLIRVMFWALTDPTLGPEWLDDDLIRYDPNDRRLLAESLFSPNSASLTILLNHLNSRDLVADRMALLGGAMWSLSALTVLTPVLLAHLDHSENLALQPMPRDLAVSVLSDLRVEILGSPHMDEFRAISRRRQTRARDEQGTEGEG